MEVLTTSEGVKSRTWSAHQALEKRLVNIIKTPGSTEDYIHLLKVFYGFYKPLEELLAEWKPELPMNDFHERRKALLLVNDINKLKTTDPADIIQCAKLPAISSVADALGVLYVMEGSTLGGPHIAKMIQRFYPPECGYAVSFFLSYGDKVFQKWEAFKEILNNAFLPESEYAALAETANNTFDKFHEWINLNYADGC
jgi:heme oxygenase